ncbi:hypothetical protein K458DRAFT_428271 [Lentithecium fluviatile CBS 122367]|uniref:Chromo domain-containing protein n=1 Tax=Lentithecium fluviatile CBS 122367 TaxID=1168545 RepID=A0A6G1JEV9_9PLEO|nr:hypothetical protein K458DRAFT_428271 [Lentithecium fluviatile CBS 122367]
MSAMDPAEYDKQYDTDEVSVTSTVASKHDPDTEWDSEAVLSEGYKQLPDGTEELVYLVKWVGYPMHECTWEPRSNFLGPELLVEWEKKKTDMGLTKWVQWSQDNRDQFEKASICAKEAKSRRHAKRVKKRNKLHRAKGVARWGNKSGSDDDTPLLPMKKTRSSEPRANATQPKDQATNGSVEKRKRAARKLPVVLSSSESEDDAAEASGDALFEEPKSNVKPRESRLARDQQESTRSSSSKSLEKPKSLRTSAASSAKMPPKSKESAAPPEPNTVSRKTVRQKSSATSTGLLSPTDTTSGPSTTQRTKPAASSMKRTPTAEKGALPIRMLNEPKTPARKAWNTMDKHFNTLHFRSVALKRSRAEGTPDPTALDFVNGRPEGLPLRPTEGRSQAPTDDSPYGRREAGQRRIQEPREGPQAAPKTKFPLQPFETSKIPLVCFDWRSGSCPFTAEKCKFLHRTEDDSGRPYKIGPWKGVPAKYLDPPQTCFYWLRSDFGCNKAADDCDYAHENTGWLTKSGFGSEKIDRNELPKCLPRLELTCHFWFSALNGCRKPSEQCEFAHRNTGFLGNPGGRPCERIDPDALPQSKRNQRRGSIPAGSVPGASASKLRIPSDELTCFFWALGICKNSEQECQYQHRDTDAGVADPPKFWKPMADRTSSDQLRDQEQMRQADGPAPQPIPDVPMPDEPHFSPGFNPEDESLQPPMDDEATPLSRPLPAPESPPTQISCIELKRKIEDACKLNFTEMFTYNYNQYEDAISDRRAFVLFHPEDHMEELELITRWMLMHHVEVYSFWSEGAWDHFKDQIVKGGSGVIVAHPDFEHWADIPDFGEVLRGKVRLWSVGPQEGFDYGPQMSTYPPTIRYDRIEIFPHGGIIYITDDVFIRKPVEALKIMELFIAKIEKCRQVAGPIEPWKQVDDGCLLWRLAVRPELMQALYEYCEQYEEELEAQDPLHVSRAKIYELLSATGYIEQDGAENGYHVDDYFPIISERFSVMEDYYYPALTTSQSLANTKMIQYFGGMLIDLRHDYRQYFVVHTDPHGEDAKNWKAQIQNIDEVMSPEKFIEEFQGEPRGNRFDFFEWSFPLKKRVDSPSE